VFGTSIGNAEILDLGYGLKSSLTHKDIFSEARKTCVVTECHDSRVDLADAWTKCKARVIEISAECAAKRYPYKTVIIDELTAAGMASLRYILMNGGRLFGLSYIPTVKTGITQPEWGLAMQEITNLLIVLRSLPVHVILIAHDNTEDTENPTNKVINVIGRKLTPTIPGFFDEYLHMSINPVSKLRELQTQPTATVIARTRGQLPNPYPASKGMRQLMIDAGFSPEL
jgi:hypothetical protein